MAHVAVNTRLLLPDRQEGISRFAFELLRRMAAAHPEVSFTWFFDRPFDPTFITSENIRPEVLFPQARHPLLWHAWFHGHVRWRLSSLKPDVFFSPELYLSFHPSVPEIATFHDLAYEHFAHDVTGWAGRFVRKYSPRYARHAREIVTVSDYTRKDLVQLYGVREDKIHVVPNAAWGQVQPLGELEKKGVQARYAHGKPYVHFVGTIQPRKNLEGLLTAFDQFKTATGAPHRLLLVGRPGWHYQAALECYKSMTHKEDVVFTGYVSEQDLHEIYSASEGLIFVPWLEGFGIPLVEAFWAEVPVIASNTSALPEVVGEAALLVDPGDPTAIAQAMVRLVTEDGLAGRLVEAGKLQREQFSWDQSAEKLWAIISRYL